MNSGPWENFWGLILFLLVVFAIPLAFLLVFYGAVWVIAWASGWRTIAARFPGALRPTGQRHFWVGVRVNGNFDHLAVTAYTAPDGLHLLPWKILHPFYPRLFIPWREIHHARSRSLWLVEAVRFEIGTPTVGQLELSRSIFDGQPVPIDGHTGATPPPPMPPPLPPPLPGRQDRK